MFEVTMINKRMITIEKMYENDFESMLVIFWYDNVRFILSE